MAELEHSLTPRQVLERVLAEGLERRSGGQPITTQIVRDLRDQRLAAVPGGDQARHMVERRAEVVTVADFRSSRMQRHPGANRGLLRPPLCAERALRGERRLDRARCGGEGGTESVACGLEDVPAVRLDMLSQQGI